MSFVGWVIPGRCEASNPESRDSGCGPSDHPGMTSDRFYFAATLLLAWAARSRSITVRQPVLSSALCLNMQAVIFGTSGISELHSRNASPVHICCASALKAKLWLDDSAA